MQSFNLTYDAETGSLEVLFAPYADAPEQTITLSDYVEVYTDSDGQNCRGCWIGSYPSLLQVGETELTQFKRLGEKVRKTVVEMMENSPLRHFVGIRDVESGIAEIRSPSMDAITRPDY